ncbi:MAG: alpha/beta hydrolase [Phycisphaerales bacterium]
MDDDDVTPITAESLDQPPPPRVKAPAWRQWLWRVGRVVLLTHIGVALVLGTVQTKFIFPGAATQGQPYARVIAAPDTELVQLTTPDGQTVTALFGWAMKDGSSDPGAANRPTILFFYGNGMCLADALDIHHELRQLGANVLIPDYLGYGLSSGAPSEAGCYATADACYDYLLSRDDVDETKIIAAGWSMGAGTAVDLASRRQVAGVALFSSFTSISDMARRIVPLLPVSLILQHKFDNERKLATIDAPVFLAHGRRDSIIPAAMSAKLARIAGDRLVEHMVIEDADHNDFFYVGGKELYAALGRFIETATAPDSVGE